MRSVETPRSTEENEGDPRRIARTVLVAPIPVSQFLTKIAELEHPQDIYGMSFVEVALIKKSSKSIASKGLIMPVGGKVGSESIPEGALREVSEEVTMTAFSEKMPRQDWADNLSNTFTYFAPGYKQARALSIFVLPVQSRSFSMHKARERDDHPDPDDKIEKVVQFSPNELRSLIESGSLDREGEPLRAAGSFSVSGEDEIEISDADRQRRDKVLGRVISEVEEFDRKLKEATLDEINELRKIRKRLPAHDLSECGSDEISRGFVGAQLRMSLADEAEDERRGKHHRKMSLLRALPYFASKLQADELTNLLFSVPNHEGRQAAVQLERGFTRGAEVIISAFEDPLGEHSRIYSVFDRETTTNKLMEVWPQFLDLPAPRRAELIRKADKAATEEIVRLTGASEIDVQEALRVVEDFHDALASEMRAAGLDSFQEYRPMNELSSARLFTRMVFALGLHPNNQIENRGEDELRTLRFEALRSLVIFNVAVEASEKIRKANNDIFQAALDSFFGFPPESEMVDLGDKKLHSVYHRKTKEQIGGRFLHLIVDERPKKTPVSATRKLFLSPELNDIFSINFVLADDNFANSTDPIGDRLETSENFRNSLIGHVQNVAGSDWSVFMLEGKHNSKVVDEVERIASNPNLVEEDDQQEKSGKRAGSSGDAIVRDKFILCLSGPNGEEETIEVNIYPFQSIKANGLDDLRKRKFWGFVEKLGDDYRGEYKAKRILLRDKKEPTKPSLYELLYPRRFYKKQADAVKEKHVRSRRSRKGLPQPALE